MSKHVHKYHKVSLQFVSVWKCALPKCTHWMPPHLNNILIGRSSVCWYCGGEMVLDEDNMKSDMPVCLDCSSAGKIA